MTRLEIAVALLMIALGVGGATADDVDLHDAALTIDQMMAKAFEPTEPGAAIAVVKEGRTVLRSGYGLADLELGVAVEPDMVFRVGSITKTFTALAVLTMAERGELSLDDVVSRHLPDAPAACRDVTIAQLMSHTGGVPDLFDGAYYSLLETRAHALLNDEVDAKAFVDLLRDRELDFAPGEAFSYSNGGYFLLGRIIEVASGASYPEFIATSITIPLGLQETNYYDPIGIKPERVRSYLDDNGGFINNPYAPLAAVSTFAAGGLESSVDDLVRFAQVLQSDELLSDVSAGQLFESRTTDLLPASRQYGLGTWIGRLKGRRMVWHGGDIYGFSGTMVSLPDDGIFVVILTGNPYFTSGDLDVLARRAAAELLGDPFPPRVRVELLPEELSAVVGVYRTTDGTVREISVEEGRLYLARDGGRKVEAIPSSPTLLFFDHTMTYVTIETDGSGRPTRLILHRDSGDRETALKEP